MQLNRPFLSNHCFLQTSKSCRHTARFASAITVSRMQAAYQHAAERQQDATGTNANHSRCLKQLFILEKQGLSQTLAAPSDLLDPRLNGPTRSGPGCCVSEAGGDPCSKSCCISTTCLRIIGQALMETSQRCARALHHKRVQSEGHGVSISSACSQ